MSDNPIARLSTKVWAQAQEIERLKKQVAKLKAKLADQTQDSLEDDA